MVDETNIKGAYSDVRDLRAESTMLSNVWKNLNGDITNIRSTLHTTVQLTENIRQNQQKITNLQQEKLKIQKSLSKYSGDQLELFRKKLGIQQDLTKLSNKDIKKIDDEIRLKQKSIEKDESSIVRNEQVDSLKQRYLKNQILISMTEWKSLHAVERKFIWLRLTLAILEKTFETYNKIDAVVTKTRQSFGMLPEEGRYLFDTIKDTTIQMSHLGVTFEDVGNAIVKLSNEFTGIVAENETLLETSVMLSKSFGISNEISTKFLKTLAGITGTTASSQTNMAGFAKNIASASGVPLDQLMSDVANASDNVRMFVGDSADKMVKVAAEARMLGTSLSEAADTAKSFLDFESSINAELKASALLGRQINFNEIRRMAFNKDTIGVTKEILRLTKEVGFNQLNPIQQEAYAKAAGKSVTELQSMLQQEKNLDDIRSHGSEKDRERLKRYEEMLKFSEDRAKDEGEIARLEMLKLSNQTRMAALQDQFNQLILELQEPILEIVEPLMHLAVNVMPLLISGLKIFSNLIVGVRVFIAIFKSIQHGSGIIKSMVAGTKALSRTFTGIGKGLVTIFKGVGFIGKFAGILKIIPGLGQIITALTFIGSLMKNWASYVKKDGLLVGGFKAIGDALYDALIKPFVDAFKFIFPWLGQSPSEIGLSIVKGISSIGSLLFKAIISPWIMGYNWIQSSFIGKLIPGGTIKMPSLGMGGEDVSDSGSDSNKTSTSLNDIKVSNEVIASKIDELITLMANGGISVNLDGTRVNESLDTSRFNRGNRGIASSIS